MTEQTEEVERRVKVRPKFPHTVIVETIRQMNPGGRPEPDEGTVTYVGGEAHVDEDGTLRIANPGNTSGRYRAVYRRHEYSSFQVIDAEGHAGEESTDDDA